MMNVEIAQRLAELRRERGFSQEGLAEQLGLSRQAVSKWERAESAPDMGNLIALADLYEVTLDELLRVSPEVEEDVRYESQDHATSAETQAAEAAEEAREAAARAEAAAQAAEAPEAARPAKVVVEVAPAAAAAPAAVTVPVPPTAMPGPGAPFPPMAAMPVGGVARPPMPGGASTTPGYPTAPIPMGGPAPMPPVPMAPPPPAKPNDPLRSFPYPVLCAAIYLLVGFCFGWWHPGWVIFFTIPFYYWIVSTLEADPAYQTWLVERERAAQDAARENASTEGGAR